MGAPTSLRSPIDAAEYDHDPARLPGYEPDPDFYLSPDEYNVVAAFVEHLSARGYEIRKVGSS